MPGVPEISSHLTRFYLHKITDRERGEKKEGSSRLRNRNENRRDKRRMQERDKKIRRVCVRACARVCERESSFIPRRFFNSEKRALSVRYGFESCVKESLFANDRQ